MLVGFETFDDAAVYKITDDIALILTIDFFPPIVDDPYQFGAIAAVNAVSDVFAMGGEVIMATNLASFPANIETEVIGQILQGGADKIYEAGGIVVGGHSTRDKEPKYGLSVLGKVNPNKIWRNIGAEIGDVIILTKPLGTGVITTSLKGDMLSTEDAKETLESMLKLNRSAKELLEQVTVHSATDITGFGLLGHIYEMAKNKNGENIQITIEANEIPLLPYALEQSKLGMLTAGCWVNRDFLEDKINIDENIPEDLIDLLFDSETSGGLLVSIPADELTEIENLFNIVNEKYWIIGYVEEGKGVSVINS